MTRFEALLISILERLRLPQKTIAFAVFSNLLIAGCGVIGGAEAPATSATTELVEATFNDEEVAVADWLRAEAIELKTDDPNASYEDLEALREIVGDARIVLLGEQTHGTHEFFTMRHRVIRFLVEELGFNALAVEAPWGPGNAVNDYIHGVDLDGRAVMEGMQYWTFATYEALDMIEWMRDFNAEAYEADQIDFYGMDMQIPKASMANVVAKLNSVSAEASAKAEAAYACFYDYQSFAGLEKKEQDVCADQTRSIYEMVESREVEIASIFSKAEYEHLLQETRVVVQGLELSTDSTNAARDRGMAENVAWVLEQSGPDGKVIAWAHNAHIAQNLGRLGGNLEKQYGDDVVAIGMALYQGSFMAISVIPENEGWQLTEIDALTAPEGTYEYYLNLADYPYMFIDLSSVDVTAPGAEWLDGIGVFRGNGAQAGKADLPDRQFAFYSLLRDFDAIIFIRDTTPSMPLKLDEELD